MANSTHIASHRQIASSWGGAGNQTQDDWSAQRRLAGEWAQSLEQKVQPHSTRELVTVSYCFLNFAKGCSQTHFCYTALCAGIEQQMPTDIFLHMHTLYITIYLPRNYSYLFLHIFAPILVTQEATACADGAAVCDTGGRAWVEILLNRWNCCVHRVVSISEFCRTFMYSGVFSFMLQCFGFPSPDELSTEDRKGMNHGISWNIMELWNSTVDGL